MAEIIEAHKGAPMQDSITIVDLDAVGPNKGLNYIELPFIPNEVNWNSNSNFVAIRPMGRNNPKYHFTGAEDKVEFEIDWHSFNADREDVIRNCRALEALSKSDSYDHPPHRVLLQWGWENILFRDIVFVVIAAPYRLTRFNKAQKDGQGVVSTALLPIQAYQKVTLARVTSNNISHKDIKLVNNI